MDCPKCIGRLERKTLTIRSERSRKKEKNSGFVEELEIDQCFSCGGVWFDKGEMEKYLSDQITIIDSPSRGKELDKQWDEKRGKCPRCNITMQRIPAPKIKDLIMDRCEKCGGTWLDSTEIDRLEKAYAPKFGFLSHLFKKS